MKSFFKKIALVLTLAMVVGLIPANTASAAATPSLKYTSKILYIGGDLTGDYNDWCWTPSQNTKGYDVSYTVKSGQNLVTVSKNGKIEATGAGVGKAVITVTYTKDGNSTSSDFSVFVKKNATDVRLTNATVQAISEALPVGTELTLKTAKTASDYRKGNYGLDNYTKVITDQMRIISNDESVVKVDGFKLIATGVGSTTLTVESYQKEGSVVTASKQYPIVVAENFKAEQSAWNAFQVTFSDAEEANTAVEKTKPSLNTANADVTENKEIIKVYKVLKDTNGQEVAAFIGSLDLTSGSNVATVTMFDELEEETEYIIRYQGKETKVTTIKNVADSLEIVVSKTEKLSESSSKSTLGYKIYSTGPNKQKIDISGSKRYAGWNTGVNLTDLNTAAYHEKYNFDSATPAIWFYTAEPNYAVNVKATFEDWFNIIDNKANVLTATKSITPGDTSVKVGTILDWGVVKTNSNYDTDDAYASKKFAVGDDEYGLAVKIEMTEYGATTKVRSLGTSNDKFTFVSSNDDKLAVNKETGALYPPKTAVDGIVGVYVYYDDQFVGVCQVQVYAKRNLTTFNASLDTNKLSYNPIKDVDDELILTLNANDQLGESFNNNMSFEAQINGSDTTKSYVTINRMDDKDGRPRFSIKANSNLPATVTNFLVVCTATYDRGGNSERIMKYSVNFTAKNTSSSEAKSYSLITSGVTDMIIDSSKAENQVNAKNITIKAYSYDKDYFKVEHLQLANQKTDPTALAKDASILVVKKGNDGLDDSNLRVDNRDIVFKTVVEKELKVASGSAIETLKTKGIEKVTTGTYVANLFVGNSEGKAVFKASAPIVITDTQKPVAWNWDKVSTTTSITDKTVADSIRTVNEAIRDCFTFKYDINNDGVAEEVDADVYVGYVAKDKNGNYTDVITYADDYEIKGDKVTVKQVRYLLTVGEYSYEMIVPVLRTITCNVPQ